VMIRPEAPDATPFLATCALDFAIRRLPRAYGLLQNRRNLRVAGGYAYLMTPPRPSALRCFPTAVLEVRAAVQENLLLFVAIMRFSRGERAAGVGAGETVRRRRDDCRHRRRAAARDGWEMKSDRGKTFTLDLRSGSLFPRAAHNRHGAILLRKSLNLQPVRRFRSPLFSSFVKQWDTLPLPDI